MPKDSDARSDTPAPPRRISSETLLQEHDQVLILHRDVGYLLRATKAGKLTLSK